MKSGNPILVALWQADRPTAILQICEAMRAHSGNAQKAAEALGVHRRTLYRWMQEEPAITRAGASNVDDACPFGAHALGEGEDCGNCVRYRTAIASTLPPAPAPEEHPNADPEPPCEDGRNGRSR